MKRIIRRVLSVPSRLKAMVLPPAPAEHVTTVEGTRVKARALSYDGTPPVDYEPPHPIDYESASLTQIADHYKTDKGSLKHEYSRVYERYFEEMRGRGGVSLMEIGVACGASLKTWARYFRDPVIVGVDIRPECTRLCRSYPEIEIRIQDATRQAVEGRFDIIIDDGSHVSQDIVDTFRLHWPSLEAGGLYVIEDLKCTHDPGYAPLGGAASNTDRFDRSHFMSLVDQLLRDMDYRRSAAEYVHFYREIAFIRKKSA